MDIVSHALWSYLIYHKADTPEQLLAVALGVAPDLIPFAPMTIRHFVKRQMGAWKKIDKDNYEEVNRTIPRWVHRLYDVTHSIHIWIVWFCVLWAIRGSVPWPAFAWLIHIVVDIPTHTKRFFPTPFLWPISSFKVDGFSWAERWFMRLNYGSLILGYILVYVVL